VRSTNLALLIKGSYRAATLSRTFSSRKALATATAAAHDTALPAYVPPLKHAINQ
jgi:hypothetical protein